MNLLHYEFDNNPPGSYNALIGDLVKQVRHFRDEVPADEFKSAIPALKQIEAKLQGIDKSVGEPERWYIKEIMDELAVESEKEDKVMAALPFALRAVSKSLFERECNLDEFSYDYSNIQAVQWMEFYGYKEKKGDDSELYILKEVFRSVCYQHNVIFIDSSLSSE